MPVDDAPEDDNDSLRQTYNFAPGNHGLVYRAELPDSQQNSHDRATNSNEKAPATQDGAPTVDGAATHETKYKLQAMKWGLIPFWTKRAPDYGGQLKTINCRDDSLAQAGGMWNTMKQKKRCIIIAEGFYEWLKKNGGREKVPHFVKRKDGQLMCLAGLWDCVKYQGQEEELYTYTIITTSSNKQLKFLHDRMPVILDNGSDAMKTWLDPGRSSWSKELQTLLRPYDGELECYPVDKAVGKVGNNSPSFIIPIDSKDNKKNIANFFAHQKDNAKGPAEEKHVKKEENKVKTEGAEVKQDPDENRQTVVKLETSEDNAPLPVPQDQDEIKQTNIKSEADEEKAQTPAPQAHDDNTLGDLAAGVKRNFPDSQDLAEINTPPPKKMQKTDSGDGDGPHLKSPERALSGRKTRSATSNGSAAKTSPSTATDGSRKITSFFGK